MTASSRLALTAVLGVALLPTSRSVAVSPTGCWLHPHPPAAAAFARPVAITMRDGFDEEMFKHYANPEKFDGTDLTITEFPSRILRDPNRDIVDFDDKFQQLCKEMFAVMYGANGVGLAAPQVGLNLRLFVYNPDPGAPGALKQMGERVVANPKILEYCQPTDVEIEGCLSSRAECCRGDIKRCKQIDVEYQDERGRLKRKKLRGFEARVFQHEFDHIDGVLHIDRQSPTDRSKSQPFLDVLIEQHGPGGVLEPPPEKLASLQPEPAFWIDMAPDVEKAMQQIRSANAAPKGKAKAAPAPAAAAAKPKGSGFGGGVSSSSSKGKGGKAKKKKR